MTLIIMLGLYFIVVTKVKQQLLPIIRREKGAAWLQYLFYFYITPRLNHSSA